MAIDNEDLIKRRDILFMSPQQDSDPASAAITLLNGIEGIFDYFHKNLQMSNPEFKHLNKRQLNRRVRILRVVVYLAGIIAIASFIAFFIIDYKFDWSWFLIALTYTLLPINFVIQIRRMRKEIAFREERRASRNSGDI